MLKTALLIAGIFSLSFTGVYDFHITATDGTPINLDDFRGKKILFVNTSTNSAYVSQYAALEELYQQHKDSLVIIAIPSNSFGNEPGDDTTIQQFITNNYPIHYLLATKTDILDSAASPLYSWLGNQRENGVMDNMVNGDFFKYLVDEEGVLRGVFDGSVDPLGEIMQQAIGNQYISNN